MAPIILPIINLVGGLFTNWLTAKHETAQAESRIKAAQVEATVKRLQTAQDAEVAWDNLMADGSKDSWKDEFWTVFLSVPLVMLFWPDPSINKIAAEGFERMDNAPQWYVAAVMMAIAAAFGFRKFVQPWLDRGK